ncbi:MAG: LysM peptidoglycan-binding domain-containing protein [Bacteroidales bacterium]|nr:LysM peptidoglycan-binding domain-containing protein [Bacteroidales bacterium]
MNIHKIIAVALAAVFTATAASSDLAADNLKKNNGPKTKIQLQKENKQLRSELDSLRLELERYRMEAEYADSIANEMMDLYTENEDKSAAGINPEDYTAEISDSLLNIWYVHKRISADDLEGYDMDSVRFQSNVPDEVYLERIKKMNSFITLPYNDIVRNYIILYSEKMPTKMSQILGLCQYYMPIFEEVLNRYDMPEELKAMAVIESALNPLAVSRAGAKGMWQFMYSTAKIYGLHIDSFVDERMDPFKSAEAAAQYLQDSYEIFGDWNLAIASYNCGAGNVNKAIRRSGGSRAFWDIYPYLPRETRGYVPAFVGALYTMTYYKEHGIRPEAIEMPVHVDTFKIDEMVHLKQVRDLTGAPLEELKNLNPQYRHEIIPGNEREYILRIPYTYTNAFIEYEDSLAKHNAAEYFNPVTLKKIKDGGDGERIVYRVKSGDYLGRIASRHRCTVAQIKRWNNLKSNNIRVGQRLVIYRGGVSSSSSSVSGTSSASTSSSVSTTSAQAPSDAVTYIVRKGDVLGKIAERHGCSVAQIKAWNGLTSNNIQVGQKLKVADPETPESKPEHSSSPAPQSGEYTTYVIKEGDSFYSIAKNYPGVSAQNIMDFNGLTSAKIKPGMTIRIPKL